MDEGALQDGAINLSTSRDGQEELVNGDVTRNGENNHDTAQGQISQGSVTPVASKPGGAVVGAAKRKSKTVLEAVSQQQAQQASPIQTNLLQSQQPLLMMASQHGLTSQQVQQLVQQQLMSPQQLQTVMQQQQTLIMQQQQQKVHEQMLQQLNEQLQLNVLQQSQLIQQQQTVGSDKTGKSNKQFNQQLQQLALQQQQLAQQIGQIQMQQRQYLLACLVQPFNMAQAGMMTPTEIQQLWKEVAAQSGLEDNSLKSSLNGMAVTAATPTPTTTATAAAVAAAQAINTPTPSFLANGAMLPVDSFSMLGTGSFNHSPPNFKHVDGIKSLLPSDSSLTSSGGSNSSVISVLYQHGFCKWPGCDTACEDLSVFLKHLNSEHQLDDRSTAQARVQMQVVTQLETQLVREKEFLQVMMQHLHMKPPPQQPPPQHSQPQVSPQPPTSAPTEPKSEPTTPVLPKHLKPPLTSTPQLPHVSMVASPMVAIPTTPTSQPTLIPPPPLPQPTASSAGPMRRRVSDKCNLPISAEIQRNRDFYKNTDVRPPFTYASLIRQAIIESPHRQLTLNEIYQWFQNTFAYFRRNEATWKNAVRHNLSLHKCFMRVENVKGAVWTVDEIEFYKRRPQKMSSGNVKSPSLSDPSSYNETLNASLRAALGETSMALLANSQLVHTGQESAEDLSMRGSHSNGGQESLVNFTKDEEMLMRIKQEPSAVADAMDAESSYMEADQIPPENDFEAEDESQPPLAIDEENSPRDEPIAKSAMEDDASMTNQSEILEAAPQDCESTSRKDVGITREEEGEQGEEEESADLLALRQVQEEAASLSSSSHSTPVGSA